MDVKRAAHPTPKEVKSLLAAAAVLAVTLSACAAAPPSPEQVRLDHDYEVGCHPSDAQGYEPEMLYCR